LPPQPAAGRLAMASPIANAHQNDLFFIASTRANSSLSAV
jgi:hypothetical protein